MVWSDSDDGEFPGTDRYVVESRLGQGGMGVVYRVFDKELGRSVALKTLRRPDAADIYRLKQEFRALADLRHPNFVDFHDLVVDGTRCFFTMELIDGVPFIEHVHGSHDPRMARTLSFRGDEPSSFEESVSDSTFEFRWNWSQEGEVLRRMLDAFPQLVSAVDLLHRSGRLHRDIKPGNVLVERGGRVVLLDFGLVSLWSKQPGLDGPDGIVGTAPYMAPEQAQGLDLGPPADWYAVGVMLYEALTGRQPFRGTFMQMLFQKVRASAPSPSALADSVPPALEDLCLALLHPEPEDRPNASAIAAVFGDVPTHTDATRTAVQVAPVKDLAFLGRDREIRELRAAWEDSRRGHTVAVHVHGSSGMGKSALVHQFLDELQSSRGAVVLRGRCHPQESVPYKTLDGVVDELSRWLVARPPAEAASLQPRHSAALVRLFPVLGRTEFLGTLVGATVEGSPQELRRRGASALAELLGRLADRRPLVLWIDDVQWGDLDGADLLRELLAPPDPPALLLLLTYRSEDLADNPILRLLRASGDDALPADWTREVVVGPLSTEDQRSLARRLLSAAGVPGPAAAEQVVSEGEGSPFLIGELARWWGATGGLAVGRGPPRVADMVQDRLGTIPSDARRILEIVSVAGRPIERSLALEAAGVGIESRPLVTLLRQLHLLRPTSFDGRAAVESYHDKIRESVISGLDAATRRERHGALGRAMVAGPNPDPESLAEHFFEAGEPDRAGRFAVVAAERAERALAFDRASRLYRQALGAGAPGHEPWTLRARLAESLANGGHAAEAGIEFLEVARLRAHLPAEANQVLGWRRTAAEQLLRSGRVTEGTAALLGVLAQVGLSWPQTGAKALIALGLRRLWLALRGLRFTARETRDIPPADLLRLDAAWGATVGLSLVDPMRSSYFGAVHLLMALRVGDRRRAQRALGYEVSFLSSQGGRRARAAAARILTRVRTMAEGDPDPYPRTAVDLVAGTAAWMGGRLQDCRSLCDAAAAAFRERCPGASWEQVSAELFSLSAACALGELADVADRMPAALREAEDRGDLYAETWLRTSVAAPVWLARNRPGRAMKDAEAVMVRWPASPWLTQHYFHLLAVVAADLYAGEARSAYQRMKDAWPRLQQALVLRVQEPRVQLLELRARSAIACAAELSVGDPVRDGLLGAAVVDVRSMMREDLPTAAARALLLRAGVAALRGEYEGARTDLTAAIPGLDAAGTKLLAATARWALLTLDGPEATNSEGPAAPFRKQRIARPERFAAHLLPGFSFAGDDALAGRPVSAPPPPTVSPPEAPP